ncbi:hypothetical protein J1N09_01605 [Aureitalea sp. L0-47]|uniref:hypothetical protein n=1 Tax=Aureitalea sp. L0-47 TaxID=2816962 RepID=UPI002238C95B|nr:hypothetical protein [Aureitalea sp. L0-47]MCW5518516.1 hypothetical protein [Aureitalea sp. L0-47]
MTKEPIYIGSTPASNDKSEIKGELTTIDNETYYKISNSHLMRPFFMSLVSDSNHWMFISSNGALSAGRKNSDYALFPYYTDDKITESVEITGSKTIVQVRKEGKVFLWEPFSERYEGVYEITRNLYKNSYGNKVIFEEHNKDLGLTYQYQWNSSNIYGFVRKSTLINKEDETVEVKVLDGLQNIVPFGVGEATQNGTSNLVDAYKRSELIPDSGLGIYALSAIIVDKAEPSEALKCNIVWSLGIQNPKYLLSSLQLDNFRNGETLHQEEDIKAEKGAYFVESEISLRAGAETHWMMLANVNQNVSAITELSEKINSESGLMQEVQDDIDLGTARLLQLAGSSDAMQLSTDKLRNLRHFSNTLFNIMRGGIFDNNYEIEKWDFVRYLSNANKKVTKKAQAVLAEMPDTFSVSYLKTLAYESDDKNFRRLSLEYMPLKFSRRHGDPSRPWNKFSINTRSEVDGSKILDYEGNWRDIFQNWEALSLSFPEFLESMIHKFLNATTFDGYNPYRVTKGGFDWEAIEEDDPWSYIGYWGDHQIIYLLKLLEILEDHDPGKLGSYFGEDLFVYANVPYKIKGYKDLLKNPKDTIDFDFEADEKINVKRSQLGADGALLRDENFFIYKVNFIEKILATVLAKVSNFIPEAGIWMNTQRPEWNDANNALVGNGVSMVTLCYLRRFLKFFGKIVDAASLKEAEISEELLEFFNRVTDTLKAHESLLSGSIGDKDRKSILDGLGIAASKFRLQVYEQAFTSNKKKIQIQHINDFINVTLRYLEHTIDANKREDNMYHAYNLMTVKGDGVSISYLEEMLEGQVAALSSGHLNPDECLALLDGLKNSALFRDDQYSYLLYPNKELPRFLEKNIIPESSVKSSQLLTLLLADGNEQIINRDVTGKYHFNGNFNNANRLDEALDTLDELTYGKLVDKERQLLLDLFEEVFNHKAFTGRSGTFFGYEGLGSIYWHMVSKLLLAVQECCLIAIEKGASDTVVGKLLEHYYEINEGIGVNKPPELYGAFPTDPYSHTPSGKGAQQPGMTGQVKEDILSRFGELGVFVDEGKIYFNPCLLRKMEFLDEPEDFEYVDVFRQKQQIRIPEDALCFTYGQVPVIYQISEKEGIEVHKRNGSIQKFDTLTLNTEASEHVFNRSGEVIRIDVYIPKGYLK